MTIKAIVVDDEKLVRKGFISLIDWASYGIEIAGEAADGPSALSLLGNREADLIFTDITMPGMSGFDLIRQARTRFPHIHSVVLTCHHEFDYVQEALRLGAIDYIVKTLLEMDSVDEVMNRIVERIRYEGSNRALTSMPRSGQERLPDRMLALVPAGGYGQRAGLYTAEQSLPGLTRLQHQQPIELEGGLRIVPLMPSVTLQQLRGDLRGAHAGRWLAAFVTGLEDRPAAGVKKLLAERLLQHLFYTLPGADDVMMVTPIDLAAVNPAGINPAEQTESAEYEFTPGPGQNQADEAFAGWAELKWALYERDWEAFVQRITQLRPDRGQIQCFASSLLDEWEGMLDSPHDTARLAADMGHMIVWNDWKIWFRRWADLLQRRMIKLSLSREVLLGLARAIRYMRAHAGEKINQADVAAHIHMSRSYFSQCFARLTGQPFGEALRELRIERAKRLLLHSEAPVYEIAFSAGFEDDKYFSRVFRERVGMLPTEFRAQGRK
ncbi:helix-turn-helix domain-containing protein [Paenibacillus sp. JX-17]|uniref:Helix-turn-helix domain-containing protein n=1 Tax=Paenibacillus lacisoli TaxID=3064525 RepID=A0ABT9CFE3_9BACL|nr:helix-turn-helix domain-containing protein [Paenibacillus sp. JX-17]MDO7907600.1 helix-turn-helix domain-containing protein [Paenibacillus sp. JX-17]